MDTTICECGHAADNHSVVSGCKECSCSKYERILDDEGRPLLRGTSAPVCPYCGEREDCWVENIALDGDSNVIDCEWLVYECACEKRYKATVRVTESFYTEKVDQEDDSLTLGTRGFS